MKIPLETLLMVTLCYLSPTVFVFTLVHYLNQKRFYKGLGKAIPNVNTLFVVLLTSFCATLWVWTIVIASFIHFNIKV